MWIGCGRLHDLVAEFRADAEIQSVMLSLEEAVCQQTAKRGHALEQHLQPIQEVLEIGGGCEIKKSHP